MKNIIGIKFGKLLVVKKSNNVNKSEVRPSGYSAWHCICECGNNKVVSRSNLIGGRSNSCGCVTTKRVTKHGLCKHELYPIHQAIIQRCKNKNHKGFDRYGGRGVSIDDRWVGEDGFVNFLNDMGERPHKHSIERVDNNGNYSKYNCVWTSNKAQSRNRSSNNFIEFGAETLILTDWAKRVGIASPVLHNRIYKLNWSIERALTEPPNKKYRPKN